MIQKLEIAGVHMDVGADLKKYVERKIGHLDRFLKRNIRESIHAAVKLKEGTGKGKNERTCEVVLHLPHETLTVHETTINVFAAVDIVETKLRMQLKKYKELHEEAPKFHQRMLSRLKRQTESI